MKTVGVAVALVLVSVFVITLVAVLLPLILLAVLCADVVDEGRQMWRAIAAAVKRRRRAAVRTREEWAALQRIAVRSMPGGITTARGGHVPAGTRVLLGDSGAPETIVPAQAFSNSLVANLHRLVTRRGQWDVH